MSMFTGIITDVGTVTRADADGTFTIQTKLDLNAEDIGASIACDGCCLTVIEKKAHEFTVHVSPESLNVTTLDVWTPGYRVNLEAALRLGDALGGHLMTGHVDGLADLVDHTLDGKNHVITLRAPQNLKRFIAAKGSVSLNGISLTVNTVDDDLFKINIIPHTWEHTNIKNIPIGGKINLEIDTIARYLERFTTA